MNLEYMTLEDCILSGLMRKFLSLGDKRYSVFWNCWEDNSDVFYEELPDRSLARVDIDIDYPLPF